MLCASHTTKAERDKEHDLAVWLELQLSNYDKNLGDMKDPVKRKSFEDLIRHFKHLFPDFQFKEQPKSSKKKKK